MLLAILMLSTPCLMEHTARMASMWSADAMSVSCPRTSRSAGRSLASRHAGASLQRSAAFLTDLVIVTVMRSQPSDRVSCSLRQPPSAFEPSAGSSGIDGSVARELGLALQAFGLDFGLDFGWILDFGFH